jgi:hypothetical protein
MAYKININLPNVPAGAKVEVPYLGSFKNGEPAEVSERKWKRFLKFQPGAKALEGSEGLVVEGPGTEDAPAEPPAAPQEGVGGLAQSVLGWVGSGRSAASEAHSEQALSLSQGNESSDEVLDTNDESKEE